MDSIKEKRKTKRIVKPLSSRQIALMKARDLFYAADINFLSKLDFWKIGKGIVMTIVILTFVVIAVAFAMLPSLDMEIEERKSYIIPKDEEIETLQIIDAEVIRCSVSCTEGYTRSGEYTHEGVIGGKYEWLGRTCNLYRMNKDGTRGEKIGNYTFLDTGYGINGSMERGESVTVWVPDMDSCYKWLNEYGDYVFIEFTK